MTVDFIKTLKTSVCNTKHTRNTNFRFQIYIFQKSIYLREPRTDGNRKNGGGELCPVPNYFLNTTLHKPAHISIMAVSSKLRGGCVWCLGLESLHFPWFPVIARWCLYLAPHREVDLKLWEGPPEFFRRQPGLENRCVSLVLVRLCGPQQYNK